MAKGGAIFHYPVLHVRHAAADAADSRDWVCRNASGKALIIRAWDLTVAWDQANGTGQLGWYLRRFSGTPATTDPSGGTNCIVTPHASGILSALSGANVMGGAAVLGGLAGASFETAQGGPRFVIPQITGNYRFVRDLGADERIIVKPFEGLALSLTVTAVAGLVLGGGYFTVEEVG